MKPHFIGFLGFALLLAWNMPTAAEDQAANENRDNTRERVLLLPFDQLDPDPQHAWITQAMLHSLSAELARERAVRPFTLPGQQLREVDLQDEQAVLRLAGEHDARYVVLGSYQVVEPNVRFTGQVLDVQTGEPIGGLKATGPVRDLFSLQDTLASQTRRQIPDGEPARGPNANEELVLEHPTPPAIDPLGPVRIAEERRRYFEGSELEHRMRTGARYDRYYYDHPIYPPYPPVYGYYPYPPYYHPPVVIPFRVWPVVFPTKIITPPPPKPAPSFMRHTMTTGIRHTPDMRQFHRPSVTPVPVNPSPQPVSPGPNPVNPSPRPQPLPPRN